MIWLEGQLPPSTRTERRALERAYTAQLLGQHFGRPVEIAHSPSGKPSLPEYPELHISISHTEGRLLIALSTAPIGIDIEPISGRARLVAERILPAVQYRAIRQMASPEQALWLYHLAFSGGEALYKLVAESRGITDFEYIRGSLSIDMASKQLSLRACYKPNQEQVLQLSAQIRQGYITSVAQYVFIQ